MAWSLEGARLRVAERSKQKPGARGSAFDFNYRAATATKWEIPLAGEFSRESSKIKKRN